MNTSENRKTNLSVHFSYGLAALFLVMTRYSLYARKGLPSGENLDVILGANFGYILILTVGYYLCLTAPRKKMMTAVGTAAFVLGPLVAPIAGYLLIAVMVFLRRKQLQEQQAKGTGPAAGGPQKGSGTVKQKRLVYPILDPGHQPVFFPSSSGRSSRSLYSCPVRCWGRCLR